MKFPGWRNRTLGASRVAALCTVRANGQTVRNPARLAFRGDHAGDGCPLRFGRRSPVVAGGHPAGLDRSPGRPVGSRRGPRGRERAGRSSSPRTSVSVAATHGRPTATSSSRPPTAGSSSSAPTAASCACSPPTAGPRRPRCRAGARSRSCSSATTPATSRSCRSTAPRGRPAASHADYAWDPAWSPDGTLLAWHEWDLPDMPWDGSRDRRARPRRRDEGRRGRRGDRSRPAPLRTRWRPARIRQRRRGLADDLDRRHRRRERPAGAARAARTCRTRVGPGATLVRVVTRRRPDRVVSQRGRIRAARDRDTGQSFRARAVEGLAPRPRLARAGDRVCAFRRGDTVASGGARRERVRPARDRARTGRWFRIDAARRAARDHVTSPATRPCTRSLYRPPGATRPPLVVHLHGGPTGQATADWNGRVQWLVQRGFAVLQPNYRGSTGYGRAYAQSLSGRWGERDVADVAAGIRYAMKELGVDPARVVLMGGSAGGFTALLVAALHPDLVHGVIALYPVTRSPRPRGDDPPVRVRLPPAPGRAVAGRGRALPRAIAASRSPPRSARRSCCCTGAPIDPYVPSSRRRWRRASRTVNGTSTRAKATAGAAPRPSPTSSHASTRFSRRTASDERATSTRGRSAARIARCCSRTAPAPTCTRPR